MIRRGFWLVTGAVLGVTGYRKATQLARTLTGAQPAAGTRPLSVARAAASRALTGSHAPGSVPRAGSVARVASAAGFVRELRAGMTEYWDLHRGEQDRGPGGRTLEDQSVSRGYPPDASAARSAGTAPGGGAAQAGEQARREP